MYEEGLFKLENILTILIGIALVSSLFLILYRRKSAKRKRLEREADQLKKHQHRTLKDKNLKK